MLSELFREAAEQAFKSVLPLLGDRLLGDRTEEILEQLQQAGAEEAACLKFLYGTLPISDIGEYEPSLFAGFVRHALYLRDEVEWCQKLPEEIFVHYVLYPRINSEKLSDCRRMFYDLVWPRVRGKAEREAAVAANHWCAEQVGYRASDLRTLSPVAVYSSGDGRCGEESVFAVTVLRSIGIAARQVYAPKWTHCDDNHAWIEVYVDGAWQFTGACGTETVWNQAWFAGPASRALLVHSRTFSDFGRERVLSGEGWFSREGAVYYQNDTARYARTAVFRVHVRELSGAPAAGARVVFEILNQAEYVPVAVLYADDAGEVSISLGLGDISIQANKEGRFARRIIDTGHKRAELVLDGQEEKEDIWYPYDIAAPASNPPHKVELTPKEAVESRERKAMAASKRKERQAALLEKIRTFLRQNPGLADGLWNKRLSESQRERLLNLAGGNYAQLLTFLGRDEEPDRVRLLATLSEKDYKDVDAEVLEDHLQYGLLYRDQVPEEIFYPYVLCPRIYYENLTAYRGFILEFVKPEQRNAYRQRPERIWDLIEATTLCRPERAYETLQAPPAACLRTGCGTETEKRILFVAICRTLGIPARLNPVDQEAEYYDGREFVVVSGRGKTVAGRERENRQRLNAKLCLHYQGEMPLSYLRNWTLGVWEEDHYRTLQYPEALFDGNRLELSLPPGRYRLITSSRMPNGSQLAQELYVTLNPGECRHVDVALRQGRAEDMMSAFPVSDFTLKNRQGCPVRASQLAAAAPAVIAFLETGKEPTEHVLNELMEQGAIWERRQTQLCLVTEGEEALSQPTLASALKRFPKAQVLFACFGAATDALARSLYVDPGSFPLLMVLNTDMTAAYGCAGYNVGSVELVDNILRVLERGGTDA